MLLFHQYLQNITFINETVHCKHSSFDNHYPVDCIYCWFSSYYIYCELFTRSCYPLFEQPRSHGLCISTLGTLMTAPTGININYVACYGLSVVGNERKKAIKKKLAKESIHLSSSFCSSPATESQELAPASICHIIITYQPLTPELHCFHQHHLGAQEP